MGLGVRGGDGERLRGVEGRKTVVREKKRERRQGEGREAVERQGRGRGREGRRKERRK